MSDNFSVSANALREVLKVMATSQNPFGIINQNRGDCRKLHTEKLHDFYFSPVVSG